jgi:long-chain acyl-CoA synthetase
MERIWLKSYPPGVPAEIDCAAFASIGDLLEKSVARFSARPAYVCMGKAISYAELDRQSKWLAAYFQRVLDLPRGARIALMLPNVLQYPVALFAALRAGYTVVNCNPLYTARELEQQLADSGAEAIVVLENFAAVLAQALPGTRVRHVVVTGLGDMLGLLRGVLVNAVVRHVKHLVPAWRIPGAVRWSRALTRGTAMRFAPVAVTQEDIAFLQYTGGTTGMAKAAVLTHGNILANLQQAQAWISGDLVEGEEIIITALPLSHIFALTANCLTFLRLGAKNVLIPNPRDIPGFIRELARHRFSVITGVNTLFNALLNKPDFRRLDFSALKVSLGGGMAVQQAVAERWRQVTGCTLVEAYGLTEASPAVTINPLGLAAFNGSIGLPLPSTDVVIRDRDGKDLPPGVEGELCVRGPQVMHGYWLSPEETAMVMTPDGFLRTGDIAVMDAAGFVRIVDRKKDMILVSGFNVYPNEVEAVVAAHPGVLEAAVVGVPEAKTGEALKLFVVRRDPELTVGELIAHCRQNLAAFKVPHRIEFRDELPKTNVGKILRRALRE